MSIDAQNSRVWFGNVLTTLYEQHEAGFAVVPDRDKARQFWNVYRNGLLHQVTFSPETRNRTPLPPGALSYEVARLTVDPGGYFVLNPVTFARRVTEIIEADFSTFEGAGGSAPSLPAVYDIPVMNLTAVSGVTGYVLGTAAPPPAPSAAEALCELAASYCRNRAPLPQNTAREITILMCARFAPAPLPR